MKLFALKLALVLPIGLGFAYLAQAAAYMFFVPAVTVYPALCAMVFERRRVLAATLAAIYFIFCLFILDACGISRVGYSDPREGIGGQIIALLIVVLIGSLMGVVVQWVVKKIAPGHG